MRREACLSTGRCATKIAAMWESLQNSSVCSAQLAQERGADGASDTDDNRSTHAFIHSSFGAVECH